MSGTSASTADSFPWVTNNTWQAPPVVISRMEELPPEAARDAESFRLIQGTASAVVVPLRQDGALLGGLTFAATRSAALVAVRW